MGPTVVDWRDLSLGAGTFYRVTSVEGWEELPPTRYDKQTRTRGHGAHPSPVWADERIVTVSGRCFSTADRDQVLIDLMARMTLDGGEEPLTITLAGRTLTASAQLLRAAPTLTAGQWGVGRFGWSAQWRCPDPLRYGPAQPEQSTRLPTFGGGLAWPIFAADGTLDWGAPGNPGQITLTNPGSADAPIQAKVVGAVPGGFEISADGDRITYPVDVPAGQTIYLDTGDGTVMVEGTADRRTNLTRADWLTVPARGSLTLQFTGLGAYDPTARLIVPGFQEVHW